MNLSLGIAILLFLLLFFTMKEGFYSDMNINNSVDALKSINKKLDTLHKTVNGFGTSDLTAMDAVTSISKTLQTKDSALYNSGVIAHVTSLKEEIDLYQSNVILLNQAMISLPKSYTVYQYDEMEKGKKNTLSLSDAIENLMIQSNKLSTKLNQIPDS
jgi:hypothetical protein